MHRIVGVDPGLIHTGIVLITIDERDKQFAHQEVAVNGLDTKLILTEVQQMQPDATFIEAYRPRSHFDSDARMGNAVNELKRVLPNAEALNNTGVKQVVSRELMELLGLWKFQTVTNHQDLRSAARIAIYGMLKNPAWNALLATVVSDALDGHPWR